MNMRPQAVWQGIAPAQGWRAVFVDDDGSLRSEPVAFWVWVRRTYDGDETEDAGEAALATDTIREISSVDDEDHFVGYVHESEDIEVWREMSKHVLLSVKREQERIRQKRESKS